MLKISFNSLYKYYIKNTDNTTQGYKNKTVYTLVIIISLGKKHSSVYKTSWVVSHGRTPERKYCNCTVLPVLESTVQHYKSQPYYSNKFQCWHVQELLYKFTVSIIKAWSASLVLPSGIISKSLAVLHYNSTKNTPTFFNYSVKKMLLLTLHF